MHPNRKYHVNSHYFDLINTEGKAYWLGFLFADATVHPNRPSVALSLARRDVDHLKKFKRYLNSGHPLAPVNGLMRVDIGSSVLRSRLIGLGIRPRKSTNGKPCLDHIPSNLHIHFWRGVFDGDGWVCYNERKGRNRGQWQAGVCGTLETVVYFSDFIYDHLGFRLYFDHRDLEKNFGRSTCRALPEVKAVCRFLYRDAKIFLDRKKLEIDKLLDYREAYADSLSNNITAEALLDIYHKEGSWNKASAFLGISSGYMSELRQKKGMR